MKEEKEFRKDLWEKFTGYRKKVTKIIIRHNCLVGKSKDEIIRLLGKEDNYYDLNEWSYFVKKNIFGGETYLLVHFAGDFVEKQRLFTIYSYKNTPILSI